MEPKTRSAAPRTPLRANYERVRLLDADAQLRECVDVLEHPDVLANDVAEAYVLLDSCCEPPEPEPAPEPAEEDEISLERFTAGVRICVTGDEPAVLRCLSGRLDPLAGSGSDGARLGLDYVAVQHDPEPAPVLGAVASVDESTPYAVLLRLLCCFTEMAVPAMVRHWDTQLFKGGLGVEPRFHLHLALWSPGEMTLKGVGPAHFSLYELTRDLGELAREACLESPPLGNRLASITCLRVDHEDIEGPLSFEWRV